MMTASGRVWAGCALLLACSARPSATAPQPRPNALLGVAPAGFDRERACKDWLAVTREDPTARTHRVQAEHAADACFTRVRYRAGALTSIDPAADDCGYPSKSGAAAELEQAVARMRHAVDISQDTPLALACQLPPEIRAEVIAHNTNTLEALARRLRRPHSWPYAAVFTFGLGDPVHDLIPIGAWRPSQGCSVTIDPQTLRWFGINQIRAYRAVEAVERGVAPVVIFSGGAVHSQRYEIFLLAYLASCRFGLPRDRILLDPCARHTHENLRNAGGLLRLIGGRQAYVVTDNGLQGLYLSDSSVFDWIGGSLDQRTLRDFGNLAGAWQRVSVGMPAGFWYTPYRFWASDDPHDRDFSCVY